VAFENIPIFYNNQALYIIKIVSNTLDQDDNPAGLGMVFAVNATNIQSCVHDIPRNSSSTTGSD
jgi:hypothetical protein